MGDKRIGPALTADMADWRGPCFWGYPIRGRMTAVFTVV
jgi:hypothetical protein